MHQSVDINKLANVPQSGPTRYLYAARAMRDFGDGFVVVLLPVYLTALGLGALEVGVVATLALFGSAVMTLGIGLLGAGRLATSMLSRRSKPELVSVPRTYMPS
jgi:hypothetical protein